MQSLKNSKNVIKNERIFRKSQMVLYDDPFVRPSLICKLTLLERKKKILNKKIKNKK